MALTIPGFRAKNNDDMLNIVIDFRLNFLPLMANIAPRTGQGKKQFQLLRKRAELKGLTHYIFANILDALRYF